MKGANHEDSSVQHHNRQSATADDHNHSETEKQLTTILAAYTVKVD